MAVRRPDLVDGLVLIAPATHPWPGRISQRTLFFALPYVGRLLAEFVVIPLGLPAVAPTVRAIFRPAPVPQDYSRLIGALLAVRPKTFAANCHDIADFYGNVVRLSARYHEIRCPTEILTGDTDAVVAPAIHAFGLARDIPRRASHDTAGRRAHAALGPRSRRGRRDRPRHGSKAARPARRRIGTVRRRNVRPG
jgi:pimeloyl-ACP methyl ester carboxylesterase